MAVQERTPERTPKWALAQHPRSRGHGACLGQPRQQDCASAAPLAEAGAALKLVPVV